MELGRAAGLSNNNRCEMYGSDKKVESYYWLPIVVDYNAIEHDLAQARKYYNMKVAAEKKQKPARSISFLGTPGGRSAAPSSFTPTGRFVTPAQSARKKMPRKSPVERAHIQQQRAMADNPQQQSLGIAELRKKLAASLEVTKNVQHTMESEKAKHDTSMESDKENHKNIQHTMESKKSKHDTSMESEKAKHDTSMESERAKHDTSMLVLRKEFEDKIKMTGLSRLTLLNAEWHTNHKGMSNVLVGFEEWKHFKIFVKAAFHGYSIDVNVTGE